MAWATEGRPTISAALVGLVCLNALASDVVAQEIGADEVRLRTRALREAAAAIRSIDFTDTDYSDLLHLKQAIGDARVVVLGEATHGDGTTFRAKARLVRFLHEEMGFDVLAWEAGLLDAEALNRTLPSGEPLDRATRRIMSGAWQNSSFVRPVFEYARRSWRTERPLIMTGFDGGRPPYGGEHYLEILDALLQADSTILRRAEYRGRIETLVRRTTTYIGRGEDVTDADRARQRRALFELNEQLDRPSASLSTRFSRRQLDLFREAFRLLSVSERVRWLREKGIDTEDVMWFTPVNFLRDGEMARLLEWLVTERYAGHRIIVWAATSHMTREASSIVPLDESSSYARVVLMGDYVARYLKELVYTIGFTAYQGRRGVVYQEPDAERTRVRDIAEARPPAGSFEDIAHRVGSPYLFVDLEGLPSDHWLREEAIAWPLGYQASRTRWDITLDAFFFIETMGPDIKVVRGPSAGSGSRSEGRSLHSPRSSRGGTHMRYMPGLPGGRSSNPYLR